MPSLLEEQPVPGSSDLLSLLRGFVGPAFVIGGWQLMSTSYVWGLIVVYSGFAICVAECIWEPALRRQRYPLQVGLLLLALCLCGGFTIGVVLITAPLNVQAFAVNKEYASGTVVAGINWKPAYTELDVIISNPSDVNYDDLNVLVKPDYPVAAISQLGNISDVSFEDRNGLTLRATLEEELIPGASSFGPATTFEFVGTNAGYKVHCGRIPPKNSLRLVLAIVAFKKASTTLHPPIPSNIQPSDLVMQANYSDGTTYWFGINGAKNFFAPRPIPKSMAVTGSYTAASHQRSTTKTVAID